jgi:hypothetical protein
VIGGCFLLLTFIVCILVEKAKESTEKSKLLKKIVMKSLLLRKITKERDMLKRK